MSHLMTNNTYARNAADMLNNKAGAAHVGANTPTGTIEKLLQRHFSSAQFTDLMTHKLAEAMLEMHDAVKRYRHALPGGGTLAETFGNSEIQLLHHPDVTPFVRVQMAVYVKGTHGTRLLLPVEVTFRLQKDFVEKPIDYNDVVLGAYNGHNYGYNHGYSHGYNYGNHEILGVADMAYHHGRLVNSERKNKERRGKKESFMNYHHPTHQYEFLTQIGFGIGYDTNPGGAKDLRLAGGKDVKCNQHDLLMYAGTPTDLPLIADDCRTLYLKPFMDEVSTLITTGIKNIVKKLLIGGEEIALAHVASEGYIQYKRPHTPYEQIRVIKLMKAPEKIRIPFASAHRKTVSNQELGSLSLANVAQRTQHILSELDKPESRRPAGFDWLFVAAYEPLRDYYYLSKQTYIDKVHMAGLMWHLEHLEKRKNTASLLAPCYMVHPLRSTNAGR